jgi:hypothetical protein
MEEAMFNKSILAAGIGLLMSAAVAQAAPITTPPPSLVAFGDVTAVYVFADAADQSILNELTPAAFNQIFCNQTGGACASMNSSGDTFDLGIQAGPMVFSLENTTRSNLFTSDAADGDGNYHVLITANYSDFNAGSLPSGADSVIANLILGGNNITYIGWEDKTDGQGSDFDYNDLIFAFANTRLTTDVPEPVTLSLFGAGLAGAAWVGRRRMKAQKSAKA